MRSGAVQLPGFICLCSKTLALRWRKRLPRREWWTFCSWLRYTHTCRPRTWPGQRSRFKNPGFRLSFWRHLSTWPPTTWVLCVMRLWIYFFFLGIYFFFTKLCYHANLAIYRYFTCVACWSIKMEFLWGSLAAQCCVILFYLFIYLSFPGSFCTGSHYWVAKKKKKRSLTLLRCTFSSWSWNPLRCGNKAMPPSSH